MVTIGNQGPQNTSSSNADQMVSDAFTGSFVSGLPGMDFTFVSPEALLELVELQLQKVDTDIFTHIKDIDARREAGQLLGEAAGAMKEAKLALEQNPNYFEIKVEGSNGFEKMSQTFPNTPEGKKAAEAYAKNFVNPAITTGATPEQVDYMHKKLQSAAEKAAACGYTDVAAQLQKMADDIKAGKSIDKGALDKALNDVDKTMQSLSSSSEMTMIKLQELMQQRSRVIMFVTNALASINETARKIVDNTR